MICNFMIFSESVGSGASLSAEKWLTDTCRPLFLFNIPKKYPIFWLKTELKNIQFVRKYLPFPGQNVLSFAIVLTLIMKIQSHNQGEI